MLAAIEQALDWHIPREGEWSWESPACLVELAQRVQLEAHALAVALETLDQERARPHERNVSRYADALGFEKRTIFRGPGGRDLPGGGWTPSLIGTADLVRQVMFISAYGTLCHAYAVVALRDASDVSVRRAVSLLTSRAKSTYEAEGLWEAEKSVPWSRLDLREVRPYVATVLGRECRRLEALFGTAQSLGAADREGGNRRAAERLSRREAWDRPGRVSIDELGTALSDDAPSPEETLLATETDAVFEASLGRLSAREHDLALTLAFGGAPTLAQAARELGIAPATARAHATNIRKKLQIT